MAWDAMREAVESVDASVLGDKTPDELVELCRKKAAEQRAKAKADPDPPPRLA